MSNIISISVEKRELAGSANSRRLRNEGKVPAVVYGHGLPTQSIQMAANDVKKIADHTGLIELLGLDGKHRAILKEIQANPINGTILNVDFQEVKAGEHVVVTIPVEATGEAIGLREGGQLEQVERELQVKGDPAVLPEVIRVDVSGIALGAALCISDIKLGDDIEVLGDPEQIVFHVRVPHAADTNEAAPAEAAAAEEKK